MIKIISIAMLAVMLSGCNPAYTDKSSSYLMPEGMKDCKVYSLEGDATSKTLTVVRCQQSETSTTFMNGKVRESVSSN
jgi:hypothetical protein